MLRSFTFLNVLKEKNAKERIVLLGFLSCQKLKTTRKRTLRALKERKRTMCSELKRTRCPTLVCADGTVGAAEILRSFR